MKFDMILIRSFKQTQSSAVTCCPFNSENTTLISEKSCEVRRQKRKRETRRASHATSTGQTTPTSNCRCLYDRSAHPLCKCRWPPHRHRRRSAHTLRSCRCRLCKACCNVSECGATILTFAPSEIFQHFAALRA